MFTLLTAILLATAVASPSPTASASAAPSPVPSPTSTPVHTLRLNIPPNWRRTESGRYNQWTSPDGMENFRLSVMPPSADFQGPNAADAIKAEVTKSVSAIHPNANLTVKKVMVCNGTEPAYRIDDPLGMGSAGFMMFIPGTVSTGFINFEVLTGKPDPAILATIDAICWP